MQWATAISRSTSLDEAVRECSEIILQELGPGPVSLVFGFFTPHFAGRYGEAHGLVRNHLAPGTFVGCSGGGVIGGGEEVEREPAVSLVAARLPDVHVTPFRIGDGLPDLDGPPGAWEDLIGVGAGQKPKFVLLANPFGTRVDALLAGLDYAFPGAPKIGGLASGGTAPGRNALFLDDALLSGGAVGIALTGDVAVDTVVAQGCRPVGYPLLVTRCEGNLLYELDGQPVFEALRDLNATLDEHDQRLVGRALLLGMLTDEFLQDPGPGDYLVRNILGADARRGALAVGESLNEGMTVQFHLRDAGTSAEDLHAMLDRYESSDRKAPAGALLFSCLGRGEYLYGAPNFDTGVFHEHLDETPVGGFFCNGEIGPVGGSTHLHGYTSSFGLFRPRSA